MIPKEHPCVGMWYVVAHDIRVAGEWECECEFAPDEWIIGFAQYGGFCEIFRPTDERTVCDWRADASSGIITIVSDPPEALPTKCVFREESRGTFLYFYDEMLHIPHDSVLIVRHHAHMRYKLMKV